MPLMNRLYDAVSRDSEFLIASLKTAAEFDDFTAKLLEIYSEVKAFQNGNGDVVLGIHRSDYMLDEPSGELLQVELNTIASSFGCLSTKVSMMHEYMVSTAEVPPHMKEGWTSLDNQASDGISEALAAGHNLMRLKSSVILMVAEPDDKNAFDQYMIVVALGMKHGIEVIRKSLSDIMDCSQLDDAGNLVVDDRIVSVVYFRAGYAPHFYPSSKEWEARRRIEISSACKCPTISYHLTGAKKVQQELVKPGRLERYLSDDECRQVRQFFAGLWGLDDLSDPSTQAIVQEAIHNPDVFVLKPQREGGGNNLYGKEAADVLSKGKGLAAYVLMQRIRPEVHRSLLVRNEEDLEADTVSELGIYGTFLRKGDLVLLNKSAGHLLRTKIATSDEGGVSAGFAVLDSPHLIP